MTTPNDKDTNDIFSPTAIIKIDGGKIRQLREAKGLTQLYVATVVGVTTDTVSRWENRRYPTIKKENGVKLAEALEASVEDILLEEKEETPGDVPTATPAESPQEIPPTESKPAPEVPPLQEPSYSQAEIRHIPENSPSLRRFAGRIIALLAVAGLLLWLAWSYYDRPAPVEIDARRILPRHVPPGKAFPVLIHVRPSQAAPPFSLIVKELVPEGCKALSGTPQYVKPNSGGTLKWIAKTEDEEVVFFYNAVAEPRDLGTSYDFAGEVTLSRPYEGTRTTGGNSRLTLAAFHWADTNQDYVIDDEEILTVYDTYGTFMDELGKEKDDLDAIWSGSGYAWDEKKRNYTILP